MIEFLYLRLEKIIAQVRNQLPGGKRAIKYTSVPAVAEASGSGAGKICSGALQRSVRGVSKLGEPRGEPGEPLGARSWLATRSTANRTGKQAPVRQPGPGVAVCAAVHAEGRAGRALKPCQLKQGAAVSTRQKATVASLSSCPDRARVGRRCRPGARLQAVPSLSYASTGRQQ